MKKKYGDRICPTCNQDMRAKSHEGENGKDCPQCGQGISWRKTLERWKKMIGKKP